MTPIAFSEISLPNHALKGLPYLFLYILLSNIQSQQYT